MKFYCILILPVIFYFLFCSQLLYYILHPPSYVIFYSVRLHYYFTFYSLLSCAILFYCVLFFYVRLCSIMLYFSIGLLSILFRSALFYYIFTLFYSMILHNYTFYSISFYSILPPLFHSVLLFDITFYSNS